VTEVRVGIVSWNTAALLDRCLAAVPASLAGREAEVVVVDNASADGSAAVARRHPVEVVENTANVGYARAMNQALAGSDAPVLIALNPDTLPGPGTLAALVDRLLAQPDVGLVAPRLVHPDGARQPSGYRLPSVPLSIVAGLCPARLQGGRIGRRWMLEAAEAPREPVDVGWVIGAVHVIRTAALGGSAPYSERWFMYVEDLELCWRLAAAGWRRRLEADLTIEHAANAAGRQAWGDDRSARWWPAVYDWYEEAHGTGARRRWAAANAVVDSLHLAARVARRGPGARRLARQAATHWRAVARVPPVPAGPPGGQRVMPSDRGRSS
jgi:N-acetylglucosaminyl-diphospho-decaprenol L-rhamnosyltransferase